MSKTPPIADVAEDITQSIKASPKKQRRLRSSTFWDKFGFERRTRDRVEQVREALSQRYVLVNLDETTFGHESKDEWIILNYVEPPIGDGVFAREPKMAVPLPTDSWFDLMARRVFESEREVEYYFVVPLLEQLGYEEDDLAIGFPVQMYEGTKKVNKEADFVLFNGLSRAKEDALLIVEAKRTERILTEDAVGQARAYAMWLCTPYYIVSNGDEVRVYLFRGAIQPDVILMTFRRSDLREHWSALYQAVSKPAVIQRKATLLEQVASV
jgi:hypothetical protein